MNRTKAEFFDRHAEEPWSSADYTEEELGKIRWLFDKVKLEKGQKVLEPGCGTGRVTLLLAREIGPEGSVTAADISETMIAACRKRLEGQENVSLFHAAVEEIDLADDSFDLALCFNVFPHLDDKPAVLNLFRRLLKPSGKLAIFHIHPSSFINDLHRKAETPVQEDMIPDKDEMNKMLHEAGFIMKEFLDEDRFFTLAFIDGQ